MKKYKDFVTETDSRMYGDDSVMGKGKPKPNPPCKGKDCDKAKPKPFMGYEAVDTDPCWDGYRQDGMKSKGGRMVPNCVPITEERRDGDVWQTDGGWAAQARGVTDYFDSREGAEAYAKGYSRQNRAAYTKTGKQKITNPSRSSGGRTLGGDLVGG